MKSTPPDFFNEEMAKRYDERNKKLNRISDNMHFLISLILKDLPIKSRILCVGVGTGAEIVSLSQAYPQWTFLGVEPSLSMLNVCRDRMTELGIADRCEFVHGYIQDLPPESKFDAALSILVGHFIKREERVEFYKNMTDRLNKGGYLVNTEISFDLDSKEFPSMLKNWESVQELMGATPESLKTLPKQLKEVLTILSHEETKNYIRKGGIATPVQFFQSFMISGWYGQKVNS